MICHPFDRINGDSIQSNKPVFVLGELKLIN